MGLANKNDRHATHLSPRELLFNGLHSASISPGRLAKPVVTQPRADIDTRLLAPRGHMPVELRMLLTLFPIIHFLSEIGSAIEKKNFT